MRTWMKWALGVVVAIALIVLFFFSFQSCNNNKKTKISKNDSTAIAQSNQNNLLKSDLEDCKDYSNSMGDSLRWTREELCAANAMIVSLNDSIFKLNTLLDNCMKGKKKAVAKKTAVRSTSKNTYTPEPQPQKQKTIVAADRPSRSENNALCGDMYAGDYNGEYGTTINDESQLVFFMSNKVVNAGEGKLQLPAPLLNSTSGQDFYWDKSKNLWICETNINITIARLESGDPVDWAAYIGMHPQWNYEMWLPDEVVKTKSASSKTAIANGEIWMHEKDSGSAFRMHIQFHKK